MDKEDVKKRIEKGISEAKVQVVEFSGGSDHYAVEVITPAFSGLPLLKRHRLVYDLFQAEIDTGEVHALSIQAFTPDEHQKNLRN